MPKLLTVITLIIFALFIILGLTRQIGQALQAGTRLENEVDTVNNLQQENMKLKNQLSFVQSEDYVEEVAHDKLNMSQKGEVLVVIPDEVIARTMAGPQKIEEIKIPNWYGWVRLFFR